MWLLLAEDALRPWVTRLRSALLQQEDMNVITMDWSDKAGGWYFQITKNSRTAGRQAGDLLHHLVTQAPSSRKLLHIVGFSLGAHAAGFCGRHLDKQYGMKPDRITGKSNTPRGRLGESGSGYVRSSRCKTATQISTCSDARQTKTKETEKEDT